MAEADSRWVWCSRIPSSGVQALAQDAENDVIFNMMSLAFPVCPSSITSAKLTRAVRWILVQVATPRPDWRDGIVYLYHCGMDQDATGELCEMYVQLSDLLEEKLTW
jgi:hypothetical protein